jgi:dUTP pyrophosphatase
MKIKFKKLHEDAVLPSYAKAGDAGLDLTAVSDGETVFSEDPKSLWYYVEYKTGLACEIPEGHVGLLFPRSSISKSALILANSIGVADSGFRGQICLRFKMDAGLVNQTDGYKSAVYKKGDRIGQLMIIPIPTIEPEFVDELSTTDRGSGGFGSTNIKKENV